MRTLRLVLLQFALEAFLATGLPAQPAHAQAYINTIDVTGVEFSTFPEISIQARVLDNRGAPFAVGDNDLTATENGQPVTFIRRERRTIGVQVVLVIDSGAGTSSRGVTGTTRAEEMRQAARRYVESMSDLDSAAIVLVDPDGAQVAQSFTSDKNLLQNTLAGLDLRTKRAGGGDGELGALRYSDSLAGLEQALTDLKALDAVRTRAVILYSSGIQGDASTAAYERIESQARDTLGPTRIPIYVIGVGREDWADSLSRLAQQTGGQTAFYDSASAPDGLYAAVNSLRDQVVLTYRTRLGVSGERTLEFKANANTANERIQTFRFTINPAPQPPLVQSVLINNGQPLRREAPAFDTDRTAIAPTEATVTAEVAWPDGYARQLVLAELLVDGQPHGPAQTSPDANLSFTWDLRSFTDEGARTSRIQVRVTDELGLTNTSAPTAAEVTVVIPPPPLPCANLEGWEASVCRLRDYLVVVPGLAALGLAIPTFILAVVAFRFRTQIGGAVERAQTAIVTTLRLRKMTPKAYLLLLDGASESGRSQFSLYGTTKIGRDRRFVGGEDGTGLLLHQGETGSPISGLHCTILEEDGHFSIRDEGSSNGTFVNGEQLESTDDPRPLLDGNIVELAEVERGGLRFRFSLTEHDGRDLDETMVEIGTNRTR